MVSKLVFSGVQPTGNLHLGNYLGAVKRFVELQNTNAICIYCLVDLHAITNWQDPKELRRNTVEVTAAFLACGLRNESSIIFNQSQVTTHTELAWIFNCVARVGWLNRMTQFKEKAGKNRENASLGLYCYPTLMAADILAYHATHVPVGEDQKQHLELTRDIAAKFNNDFDSPNFFPIPEPIIEGTATRIMSLRDGSKKMSKSETSDMSRINLTDNSDLIRRKIKKAKTDTFEIPSERKELVNRPEAENLLGIYANLSNQSIEETLDQFSGLDFKKLKDKLSDILISELEPINNEIKKLMDDETYIVQILREGSQRADEISRPILEKTREIIGFLK
ncbi:tryptophan--tRNA ligase [Paracoccaceae bacterium]|nr:tryptophan--tRNA ligase [Paracoccaceae bacterium]